MWVLVWENCLYVVMRAACIIARVRRATSLSTRELLQFRYCYFCNFQFIVARRNQLVQEILTPLAHFCKSRIHINIVYLILSVCDCRHSNPTRIKIMSFSLPFNIKVPDIFTKRATSMLGIDIGSSSIKIVQLRREHGKAVLETYGAVSLGPYAKVDIGRATQLPPDMLAQALKDVLHEANATATDAGFSIPYSASLVSMIKLPAAAEGKLEQIVPLEARKYIPVPLTEVQLDWTQVSGGSGDAAAGSGVDGNIEIMLVAIHKNTLEKYRTIATDSALHLSFFEIEAFSAVRASLESGIAPVAVVDIGAATTKCYAVERGIVRESHLINHGGQELTLVSSRALNITVAQAEEHKLRMGLGVAGQASESDGMERQSLALTLAPLFTDIGGVITSFEERLGAAMNAVVFTGGGSSLKGFVAYAQARLRAEVRISDPFSKTETPAFLTDLLRETGPEFAVAVGLALRGLQGE